IVASKDNTKPAELHRQTKILKIIEGLPRIGSDFVLYIRKPKDFVSSWKSTPDSRPSHVEVFAWCTTTIIVGLGIFAISFRCTPIELIYKSLGSGHANNATESAGKNKAYPKFIGFGFKEVEVGRSPEGEITSTGTSVYLSPLPGFSFPEGS